MFSAFIYKILAKINGGEGGIRTHVGQGPQQISSLRRYDRFEYLSGRMVAYVDLDQDTTRLRLYLDYPCR